MTEAARAESGTSSANSHRVARRVQRICVPLPFRPREVHAYLVELADGEWMLVDGGIDTDEAWAVLDAGVRDAAGDWGRVRHHVVTHMHIDHFGLAQRIRGASGARLLMGELDAERAAHADADPEDEADFRRQLLRASGAPEALWSSPSGRPATRNPLVGYVPADVRLSGSGGTLPGVEGWEWLWTPGHTAGHVALVRPEDRLVVGGDAVLPRVSPTIGVNRQRDDPVGDYLAALGRLRGVRPDSILPGHGEPVRDPVGRIDELDDATRTESRRIGDLLPTEEGCTAWQIARARYADRELPASAWVQALRETLAHLEHLAATDQAIAVTAAGKATLWTRR